MKLLKVLILLFGATGLTLVLKEMDALTASFEHAPLHTLLIVIGWSVPTVMGILAIVRPPLRSWQAAASLAGFAVVAIRTRIWKAIPDLVDVPLEGQLGLVALIGGIAASVVGVAKPEDGG